MTTFETRDMVKPDAGAKAADLMRERLRRSARSTWVVIKMVLLTLLVVALIAAGCFGYWAYKNRSGGYITDSRPCSYEIGKKTLTGTRTYSYHFDDYLGFRFIDTRSINEQTLLHVKGSAFNVVNFYGKDNTFDVTKVGTGEQGVQILKPAERYVFIFDDGTVGMSDYRSLCK